MTREIEHSLLVRLNDHLADQIGLSFARDRLSDFKRRVVAAAKEFGMEPVDCVNWLLSAPLTKEQIHTLSYHLTIGETYFFRDPKAFEILEDQILAALIRQRRNSGRFLRIWSAGCCTGEEPYSIAILLTRILPDLQSWHISILGTDINPQFLKKAEKGVYDPWSFRIVSPSIKERFFTHVHGKYEISAAIKKMVRFERMNLVDEKPPQGLILSSMDIIFCRNVLMYFDPDQAVRVLNRLHNALSDEGVLISTPFEFSALPENPFERLPHHGAVLLKKRQIQRAFYGAGEPPGAPVPLIGTSRPDTLDPQISISLPFAYAPAVPEKKLEREESRLAPALVDEARHARLLFEAGKYAECISHLLPICSDKNTSASLTYLLARAYCDRGDLPDALTWIDRAIELDRLNHCAYFTRATILEALGRIQESLKALRQALFLEPEFVVAEFYMASLLLRLGKLQESRKRFLGALSLLAQYNDDDLVPESEGITAGRLSQIIKSLLKETAT